MDQENFYIGSYEGNHSTLISCYIKSCLIFQTPRFMLISKYRVISPLMMQGGHKPFSDVTISFSPLHYLIYFQFCLIWTLLLCM